VLIAQAIGEYGGGGGGGLLDSLVMTVRSAMSWVETSFAHDRPMWIGGVVLLVVVFWFFKRR
jgi:hypothetical protein